MARTSPQKGGRQGRHGERQKTSMQAVPVFSTANVRNENIRRAAKEPAFISSDDASFAKGAQQSGGHGLVDAMTRLSMRDATNQMSQPELSASRDVSVVPAKGGDEALSSSVDSDSQSAMLPSIPVKPVIPIAPLPTLLPRSLATESEPSEENLTHARFVREALDMAHLALRTNETPVGCVLVYRGRVIAKGMNATNITRNGTRHAEYMAIGALLSFTPREDTEVNPQGSRQNGRDGTASLSKAARKRANQAARKQLEASWGDVNPEDGHLYPYGQKLHPSPRVDKSVISECVLYVTVEPCVMCASLLRQLGIRKVYFGAVNDKFGGTGGVFRIHMNADQFTTSTATTQGPQLLVGARPALPPRPSSSALPVRHGKLDPGKNSDSTEAPPTPEEEVLLEGHGGNVEPGYEVEGGWGRDEAVTLLRQFYVQENGRAPVPRKKEGRAARLAAMMEKDGHAGGPMSEASGNDAGTAAPAGAATDAVIAQSDAEVGNAFLAI